MKKIAIICALILAAYIVKPELFPDLGSGGFAGDSEPEVMLFTMEKCNTYCDDAKNNLMARGVPFIEYSLDNNEENQKLWKKKGRGSLPYLVVGEEKVTGFHEARFGFSLARYYGYVYLTAAESKYYDNHFYQDGTPKVYMYGASWCPGCKKMRAAFEDEGIDYTEYDVEEAYDKVEVAQTMMIPGYPVIFVGYQRVWNAMSLSDVKNAMGQARNKSI